MPVSPAGSAPPDEDRVFDVRFSVEYPRDLTVPGLP